MNPSVHRDGVGASVRESRSVDLDGWGAIYDSTPP